MKRSRELFGRLEISERACQDDGFSQMPEMHFAWHPNAFEALRYFYRGMIYLHHLAGQFGTPGRKFSVL